MSVPSAADAPSRLPPGYQFVRVLGRGATGWVALARQLGPDRPVAVKIMFGGAAVDPDGQQRLAREGQALARLRDDRIVGVYELVPTGDDLALVMEFVDGFDLAEAVRDEVLDAAGRLRVLADVAGALDLAGARGIVHRDVKPANVLVTDAGRGKLADFGLARLSAVAAAFRTGGETVIGTPRYMAPEQISDPAHESPEADVYSYAAMAYEVLLGRPPFPQDDLVALLHAHLYAAPPPPRAVRPSVPPAASDALLAGLAKTPRDRPSAGAIAAALALDPAGWGVPPARPRGPRATPEPPAPGAVITTQLESTGAISRSASVPLVETPVYRPAPEPDRRRVPPLLAGAVVGLLVVVIVVLLIVTG